MPIYKFQEKSHLKTEYTDVGRAHFFILNFSDMRIECHIRLNRCVNGFTYDKHRGTARPVKWVAYVIKSIPWSTNTTLGGLIYKSEVKHR